MPRKTPAVVRASAPLSTFSLKRPKFIQATYNEAKRDRKMAVGDKVEILSFDGTKHPELAGRIGYVSFIQANGVIIIEVEGGGGAYKANQLWWRRVELVTAE